MTNREAIAADIEPYSLSDDAYEKAFVDACAHFGVSGAIDNDYTIELRRPCALASMYCLNRLRVLSSENIGGISQSYDTGEIDELIVGIAKRAGLSPALVMDDDLGDPVVGYANVW